MAGMACEAEAARIARVDVGQGLAYWTVLTGPTLAVVDPVDAYLRHLRFGRSRAESTTKTYAGHLKPLRLPARLHGARARPGPHRAAVRAVPILGRPGAVDAAEPVRGAVVTAAQPSLFAMCALPGCNSPVVSWGEVCGGCQVDFSGFLRPARADQPAPTEQDLAQRDTEVAAAHARQHQLTAAGSSSRRDDLVERRANQRCWLCEERRTCARMPAGWDCDHCRAIV